MGCLLIFKKNDFARKYWKGKLWSSSYYVGTAGHVSAETIQKYIEERAQLQGISPYLMGSNPTDCDLIQVLKMICESRIYHKI